MADTFSYRPKNYSVDQLKKIAQKHHINLNRYIEEAVVEKIEGEMDLARRGTVEQLTRKIRKVVVDHLGMELSKPDGPAHAKINKRFEKTGKAGKWIPDEEARFGR